MTKEKEPPKLPAVIYVRISSVAQSKGDGLASQEARCREYAKYRGLEVLEVFQDTKTGGVAERPAMSELLAFLRKQRGEECVVIIDDINRFSRDIIVHWQLRALLSEAGGKLESPSMEFGDDSDSILKENMMASVSQHQRQKNGEQTLNRMRGRVMNGYWVFRVPYGYKYQRTLGHGNLLVRDEPVASIIQEALEGFASGRFESQGEVKRFLENQPAYPKDLPNGTLRYESVIRLLRRTIYTGYIEYEKWGISLRKGHHEPLISLDTYEKNQLRLKGGSKVPARKDISVDFPLRGFVLCGDCSKPLTACWSTSKTGKKHPYYLCPTKGCVSYRKSIRRDLMEDQFAIIVRNLQPTEGLLTLTKAMFKQAWDHQLNQSKALIASSKREIKVLDIQMDRILDRIVDADSPRVASALEQRLDKLEREKLVLTEKLEKQARPPHSFDQMFELACNFLASPWKLWENGSIALKRTTLRLAFTDRIEYCREKGFRTPKTSLPFNILKEINMGNCELAERQGFEPWRRGYRLHTFQACAFDHSATSPSFLMNLTAYKAIRCNPR